MKRRRFLEIARLAVAGGCCRVALGGGLAAALGGCIGESTSGPVDIRWDRDVDARCGMVISDRRFAAQIRAPGGKVAKFDDIGCAIFWLAQQAFTEETPQLEYWVADYRGGAWIDARHAHYLAGRKSPMGYHFAALATAEDGTIAYPEMRARIVARGK